MIGSSAGGLILLWDVVRGGGDGRGGRGFKEMNTTVLGIIKSQVQRFCHVSSRAGLKHFFY